MISQQQTQFVISGTKAISTIGQILFEVTGHQSDIKIIKSKNNPFLETHLIETSAARFVLRTAAFNTEQSGRERLQKEYLLLQDLESLSISAPRPLFADFEDGDRGFPLTIVSFVNGTNWPSTPGWDQERLIDNFQSTLLQILSIKPEQLPQSQALLHPAKGYGESDVAKLAAKIKSFAQSDFAQEAALLLQNTPCPDPARIVINHGDLHSENFLVSDDRLWLIDWELASFQHLDDVLARLFDWTDFSPLLQSSGFDRWACEHFDLPLEHFEFTRLYRALTSWLVFTASPKYRSKPLAERNAVIIRDVLARGLLGRIA